MSPSHTPSSATMRAMVMQAVGEPEALELRELKLPAPGSRELLIAVEASGCNYADLLICRGRYQVKPEPPFVPGSEVAGRVLDVGAEVKGFARGTRVLANVGFGGFASHAVVKASRAYALPEGMKSEEAAGFGVVYQTSHLALTDRARLQAGEWLLVHAAAGGVGLAALQLGKALGARVIAAASSDDKLAFCKEQGADEVVSSANPNWSDRVREITSGRGADVIYDSVGGEITERSLKCIAFGGRLLVIGFASGTIPNVALNRVMLKHIALVGLHLGGYAEHDPDKLKRCMQELFALHGAGKLRPHVHGVLPLEKAAEALRLLESRKVQGKILLSANSEVT